MTQAPGGGKIPAHATLAGVCRCSNHHWPYEALERHQGNIKAVMEELDLLRRTLNQKMRRYGFNRREFTLQ